jgi:hypothetical protein
VVCSNCVPPTWVSSSQLLQTTNHQLQTAVLVETGGIEPPSAGYQPAALPLSYASGRRFVVGGLWLVVTTAPTTELAWRLLQTTNSKPQTAVNWPTRVDSNHRYGLRKPASCPLDDESKVQPAFAKAMAGNFRAAHENWRTDRDFNPDCALAGRACWR